MHLRLHQGPLFRFDHRLKIGPEFIRLFNGEDGDVPTEILMHQFMAYFFYLAFRDLLLVKKRLNNFVKQHFHLQRIHLCRMDSPVKKPVSE